MSKVNDTREGVIAPVLPGAIVRDESGGHWFRWCHDAHSFEPWQLLHADGETARWEDLRVVEVVREGVTGA